MTLGVTIVGGSHAGVQVAASLRDNGYEGSITVLYQETVPPYQRPPLSKAYLAGEMSTDALVLRGPDYYRSKEIDLIGGMSVTAIDRNQKQLLLAPCSSTNASAFPEILDYEKLVLATGAVARALPVPGAERENVLFLRDLSDAEKLKTHLQTAENIVIIGAGFIGLEVAATARKMDKSVTIIEAEDRILARLFPPMMSDFLSARHIANGAAFRLSTGVSRIDQANDNLLQVALTDGEILNADLVVVGIGADVCDELAREAGLSCANGILVGEDGMTSDPDIYAAGDCAAWTLPYMSEPTRTESVQNAVDQAKTVAASLCGKPLPPKVVPWFWSDQMDIKLQMVGTALEADDIICRGDQSTGRFSLLYYQKDELVRVDSVNRPMDHIAARRLVSDRCKLPKADAADIDVKLKKFV